MNEADALLMRACEKAVSGRVKDAVADLLDTLGEEPEEWVVTEPVNIFLPPDVLRLVVGRTTYSQRLPRLPAGQVFGRALFVPPVATARIVSRGVTTAQALAREAFAESAAILDLIAPPGNTGSEATVVRRRGDPPHGPGYSRSGWFLGSVPISGTRFAPPYLYLSRAAARDETRRSDWQRRVLAAVRWFSRAHRSEWAADRLVSAMVALESLFLDGERHDKGRFIAERLTLRYRYRHQDLTEEDQIEWLRGLYRIRNEAAHEGREVLNDLEVDRLVDLTRMVTLYSAVHLDPDHRNPRRVCRTYEQAMRCSAPD